MYYFIAIWMVLATNNAITSDPLVTFSSLEECNSHRTDYYQIHKSDFILITVCIDKETPAAAYELTAKP